MRILIVSATEKEVQRIKKLDLPGNHELAYLLTGVGMTSTAYQLTKEISRNNHDLVLNLGIAGSFKRSVELGEVVNVVSDTFGDLGVEDDSQFLTAFEVGLIEKNRFPFEEGVLKANYSKLIKPTLPFPTVNGITVNKVHGNESSIKKVLQKFNPDVESMEGAAVFHVCLSEKIPCLQLRSISNYVEKRNRENWKIDLALDNLAVAFKTLLKTI